MSKLHMFVTRSSLLGLLLGFLLIAITLSGCFSQQQKVTQQHVVGGIVLPIGQTGNWNLIFADEFNGTSLDTTKWNTCYPNYKVGSDSCNHNNGELELYQPSQVLVNNGILTLRAEKKAVTTAGNTFNYLSGMISSGPGEGGSSPKFTFTYGYMEMRFKVPKGQGLWPAFWTLPADGSWPPEIDGLEILGNKPNTIHMGYHWNNPGHVSDGTVWIGPDFSASWHVLGLDWEPDAITWYVDGIERERLTNAQAIYHKPMYILANLAVGGWPGSPDSTAEFPADYQINYIRVWQRG